MNLLDSRMSVEKGMELSEAVLEVFTLWAVPLLVLIKYWFKCSILKILDQKPFLHFAHLCICSPFGHYSLIFVYSIEKCGELFNG